MYYPDSNDDVDFTGVNACITFCAFSLGDAVFADAEGVDFGGDSYISADIEFEIASEILFALHIVAGNDEFYAVEKFIEYGASLSKSVFTFGLSKTDLADDDMKVNVSYARDIVL